MRGVSMARLLACTLLPIMLLAATVARSEQWPVGLSFVGLNDGRWQLYVVGQGDSAPRLVTTKLEPRTPAFDLGSGKVVYIGADGSLREKAIEDADSRELLKPTSMRAYTQPAYEPGGARIYVVALREGASVDTDILVLDEDRSEPDPVVTQRSAQFEPSTVSRNELYYSNVLCTIGCGKIIQEIWRIDLVSGEAEQLTMLNAVARQPTVSPDGRWLYFSSNKAGAYHIWRMHLERRNYEQLTEGNVADTSPALDGTGTVYFIRRSPTRVQLMARTATGEVRTVSLPDHVSDLRDLEISRL